MDANIVVIHMSQTLKKRAFILGLKECPFMVCIIQTELNGTESGMACMDRFSLG